MTPISYYYLISVALSMGTLYALINIILLKVKGKTTFKLPFKKGSAEHNKVLTLVNLKMFCIIIFVNLLTTANLILSIHTILDTHRNGIYGLVIGVPVFGIAMMIYLNSQMPRFTNFQ